MGGVVCIHTRLPRQLEGPRARARGDFPPCPGVGALLCFCKSRGSGWARKRMDRPQASASKRGKRAPADVADPSWREAVSVSRLGRLHEAGWTVVLGRHGVGLIGGRGRPDGLRVRLGQEGADQVAACWAIQASLAFPIS
jgi:hypothetical protein